ncbi:MAG: hypothetical protein K0S14_2268 [Thermomicrobiales bacterium]|nr:hypothetical protein [Thermomicrobiales bacterium]
MLPRGAVVEALVETLGFRHIGVVKEEYAVSKEDMKPCGVLDHRHVASHRGPEKPEASVAESCAGRESG